MLMAVLEVESKISSPTQTSSNKVVKGREEISGKMRKIVPINAFNYDHDDVEQALASIPKVFAAKLARAKETAKDYELRTQHNIQAAQQEQDKEFTSNLKKVTRQKPVLVICFLRLAEHKVL